jgi:purine-binding chemotaxis protein CheW
MGNRQFITFYLGEDLFGLDILLVREINRNMEITPVDRAPDYVRGLINLRGQIVTVLDLGVRLNVGARTIGKETSCIVLKTKTELERYQRAQWGEDACEDLVGLLVDRIGDVVQVDADDMEPPPAHAGGVQGLFIEGVVKLQDQLLIALNIHEVLSVEESSRS